MSYARNPKELTFREVFSQFGRGTLPSSSPASRRMGYMAFSPHRRRASWRELKLVRPQSAVAGRPILASARLPPTTSRDSSFDRLNAILLKSHFSSLFSAMSDEGFLESTIRTSLTTIMARPDWAVARLPSWMRLYTQYVESRNLNRFVEALLQD